MFQITETFEVVCLSKKICISNISLPYLHWYTKSFFDKSTLFVIFKKAGVNQSNICNLILEWFDSYWQASEENTAVMKHL